MGPAEHHTSETTSDAYQRILTPATHPRQRPPRKRTSALPPTLADQAPKSDPDAAGSPTLLHALVLIPPRPPAHPLKLRPCGDSVAQPGA